MARTQLTGSQVSDGSVARADLNTSTAGSAVITKIIAGTGITLSSTGADAGTGDVTVNASSSGSTTNPPVVTAVSASTTLALTHAPATSQSQGIVNATSASAMTITVPTFATVAFPIGTMITVIQGGAGQVSAAASAGVTINNSSSLSTRTQYSAITLINMAQDVWLLTGDMA